MSKNIATLVFNTLIKKNVTDVFLYSGGSIMPLVDKFHDANQNLNVLDNASPAIRYYINANESNAGMSAVGYSKSSNKTGVVITTSGPSVMATINAMADATNDSTPLVVISGQVSTGSIGTNAFQEAPATAISRNVTKGSFLLDDPDPVKIQNIINEAFYLANNKKKGAVHIDIPKDILNFDYSLDQYSNIPELHTSDSEYEDTDLSQLYEVADLINKSKTPIIIAGRGCIGAEKYISDLVNKGICATTTLHGLGTAPYNNIRSLGMCGMHGAYTANKMIQDSDCIIAIGSRFDDRITCDIKAYAPYADIIHIDIEKKQINTVMKHRNCKYLVGDSSYVLQELTTLIRSKCVNNINQKIKDYDMEYKYSISKYETIITDKEAGLSSIIKTRDLIYEIDNQTKHRDDVIFTSGVGNHQMYMAQMLSFNYSQKFITSGSLGDMNAAMGYTIGSQIANPNKLVIGILGDGSFNMAINELNTIKTYNLPVKIFIDNNSSLEMVHCWEKLFFENRRTATLLKNPDFTNIAYAYGIKSINLSNKNNIKDVVNYVLNFNGPIVCNVITEPDYCFPLVLPGDALHNMKLSNKTSSKIPGCVPS